MQESSKSIQIEAFHVFKVLTYVGIIRVDLLLSLNEWSCWFWTENMQILQLFAANQNKPPDIVSILVANRSKLLRLFSDFKTEKGKGEREEGKMSVFN